MINPATDRVLITGAAGAIGTALRNGLRADWRQLRLTDNRPIANPTPNEECIIADVADRAAIERMMQGVAAVVYMTGVGGDYTLEDLFRVNARGMFDVFEAARLAGVKRIVYASSNHAFGCYPIEERVSPALPPRPDSLYGTFKAWGETMLRGYFDRHGIRSVSLRIGTYRTLPIDQRSLATWLSPGDVARLVDASLRHPDPGCLVVNGYSNNTRIKTFDPNWEFSAIIRATMPRTIARCCAAWASMWTGRGNGPNMAARMPAPRSVGRDNKNRGQHDRHNADTRLRGGAVAGRGGSARRVTRLCRLGHVVRPGADHGRDRQGVLQGTGKRRRSHILPSEPHGSCFDLIALVGHDVRAYPHRHGGTPRRSPPDRRRAVPAHVAPARSAGSPPSAPPRWPCGSRRSPDQLRGTR